MVKVIYKNSEFQVPGNTSPRKIIVRLGLNPESTLATRSGKLISLETSIGQQDEIKLISVVSGG
ncbi:MAG: hypothetical protein ABFD97_07095 [Syntrophobacter sp.]